MVVCQRPKRAFYISTYQDFSGLRARELCQRPKRAFYISTYGTARMQQQNIGVNALNGLSTFLPMKPRKL